MKKIFFVIVFIVLWTDTFSQAIVLDLQSCRELALENSKKLQVAMQQREKAGYEWKSLRANFFPKISASGQYAYMHKKMDYSIDGGYLPVFQAEDIGESLPVHSIKFSDSGLPVLGADGLPMFNQYAFLPDIQLNLGLRNVYNLGVILEQPLYMGGKVRSGFKMASIGKEISELNVKSNRADVLVESDEAYWQFVRVKEQEKVAEKYLAVVSELVKNISDAVETGMASQNDLLKVQVKQNEAELLLSKAKNGLTLSKMNLCRVIGIDLYSDLDIKDSLDLVSEQEIKLETGEKLDLRPEYNLLCKMVDMQEHKVALTRSDFLPQLGVMASYSYGDGLTLNGESDALSSFAAMASLKIPIYNWGEGRNKVKAAKAEREMARLKQEELTQMMHLEIAKAKYSVEDAVVRVRMTEKSLKQAEENLDETKNQFEVGMENITNYLEAQAQWQKAWSDVIDAFAALRLSETYYLKAVGKL